MQPDKRIDEVTRSNNAVSFENEVAALPVLLIVAFQPKHTETLIRQEKLHNFLIEPKLTWVYAFITSLCWT